MAVSPVVSQETVEQVPPRLGTGKTGAARRGAPVGHDRRVDKL
ncbi:MULTISPECIES: hypothetical protein [unclassified Pseudomonas]|nr:MULTISPECIES: hypothetical protein [unclassified Pseudomonas]